MLVLACVASFALACRIVLIPLLTEDLEVLDGRLDVQDIRRRVERAHALRMSPSSQHEGAVTGARICLRHRRRAPLASRRVSPLCALSS